MGRAVAQENGRGPNVMGRFIQQRVKKFVFFSFFQFSYMQVIIA
jgi:hypothetical protein